MRGSCCVVGRNMGAEQAQTHPISDDDFVGSPPGLSGFGWRRFKPVRIASMPNATGKMLMLITGSAPRGPSS